MSDEKREMPWVVTCFCLLAMVGLAAMPFLVRPPGGKMPDWVNFFGHFHPVALHMPIGVFLLIVVQEAGAMISRRKSMRQAENFPLFFGAASAVIAAIAGFLLYQGGGEDYAGNDVAERHLWGGIIFAIAAIFTYLVKRWTKPGGNPLWYRLLLFGSAGIMTMASHDGGTLTHGEGFLTRHAPLFFKTFPGETIEPAPSAEEDPVVFSQFIMPMMERHCISCHKEGKAKGKLRVDTYEAIMKGGLDGPSVELGKSDQSLLVERMELPLDDDARMPPKGKAQPNDAELLVLKWWIDAGASPDQKLSQANPPEEIRVAISSLSDMNSAGSKEKE